ncbi:MAG TPA: hypothetical protein VGL23_22315 [Chloroflexota bacterium]
MRSEAGELTRAALVDGLTDMLMHPALYLPDGDDANAAVRAGLFAPARARVAERLEATGRAGEPRPITEAESRAAGFDAIASPAIERPILAGGREWPGVWHDAVARRIVDQPGTGQPSADPAALRAAGRLVWRAAAALPPGQYMALDLHLRQGLSDQALARALGLPSPAGDALLAEADGALRSRAWAYALVPNLGAGDDATETTACPQMAALARRLEGEAPGLEDWLTIERHASVCPICSAERERLGAPSEVFARLAPVPMPIELKNAVWRDLAARWPDDEHPTPSASPPSAPAGAAEPGQRQRSGLPGPTGPAPAPGATEAASAGPPSPGQAAPPTGAAAGAGVGPARTALPPTGPEADPPSGGDLGTQGTGGVGPRTADVSSASAGASALAGERAASESAPSTDPTAHGVGASDDDPVGLASPYVRSRAATELLARTRQARIASTTATEGGPKRPDWLVDDSSLAPARPVRLRTGAGFHGGRRLVGMVALFVVGAGVGLTTTGGRVAPTLPSLSLPAIVRVPFAAPAQPGPPGPEVPTALAALSARPEAPPSTPSVPSEAPSGLGAVIATTVPTPAATAAPTLAATATPAPTDTPVAESPTAAPSPSPAASLAATPPEAPAQALSGPGAPPEPPATATQPPAPIRPPPPAAAPAPFRPPPPPTATAVPPTATPPPPPPTAPPPPPAPPPAAPATPAEPPPTMPPGPPTPPPSGRPMLVPVTPTRR